MANVLTFEALDPDEIQALLEDQEEREQEDRRLLCAACGDFRTRLLSGDELLLTSLELERQDT